MRSVGKQVQLLALDGRNAELAGGLSSNPILSGLRRTAGNSANNYLKQQCCAAAEGAFWAENSHHLTAKIISKEALF